MSASLVPGKGCGCSGGSVPLNESQLKQQLEKNKLFIFANAQIHPMRRATCYHQSTCDWGPPKTVWKCVDVFWPCDWFGGWHKRFKCTRKVLLCKTDKGTYCYQDIDCDCTFTDCCDMEYDDCLPGNQPCSELHPCPTHP